MQMQVCDASTFFFVGDRSRAIIPSAEEYIFYTIYSSAYKASHSPAALLLVLILMLSDAQRWLAAGIYCASDGRRGRRKDTGGQQGGL
jgi:hypothetical protein